LVPWPTTTTSGDVAVVSVAGVPVTASPLIGAVTVTSGPVSVEGSDEPDPWSTVIAIDRVEVIEPVDVPVLLASMGAVMLTSGPVPVPVEPVPVVPVPVPVEPVPVVPVPVPVEPVPVVPVPVELPTVPVPVAPAPLPELVPIEPVPTQTVDCACAGRGPAAAMNSPMKEAPTAPATATTARL
jgi:signal-induced proliferation-associated 1 like protein 3